jgi:hypothetical protein
MVPNYLYEYWIGRSRPYGPADVRQLMAADTTSRAGCSRPIRPRRWRPMLKNSADEHDGGEVRQVIRPEELDAATSQGT